MLKSDNDEVQGRLRVIANSVCRVHESSPPVFSLLRLTQDAAQLVKGLL